MFKPARSIAAAMTLIHLTVLSLPLLAATFTVGGDVTCTHGTVQAAINAAQSVAEPSVIRISRNVPHVQQGLVANVSHNLELSGGSATCLSAADNTKTVLDGVGGAAASVLRIVAGTGVTVIVRKLQIQGGDPAGENAGGGIFFGGSGTLEVSDSTISNNTAGNGGGIYAGGAAPGAKLIIGANVAIRNNEARFSGGGVFINGAQMDMLAPNSAIFDNTATGTPDTGYGGGLMIRPLDGREALVRIGGAGAGTGGVIYNNAARVGGGIAVLGDEESRNNATLQMFTTTAGRPAAIRHNTASIAGGGLFLETDFLSDARAELWAVEITDNEAPSGAAAYLTQRASFGAVVPSFFSFNRILPTGALPCASGAPCGAITGNRTVFPNGDLHNGAVVQVQPFGTVLIGSTLGGVLISENMGGRLIDVQPRGEINDRVRVENSLLTDNVLTFELLRADDNEVTVVDSTIAGNSIGAANVMSVNDTGLHLHRLLIAQPGRTTLSRSGGSLEVTETIAGEAISLGGLPGALGRPARFVDPEHGDYRPRAGSPAVDYAVAVNGSDVGGHPRNVDLPVKLNSFGVGTRDVGAWERQSLDPLVLNGTFETDLRLWSDVTGVTSFDGEESVETGTGSAFVSGEPPLGDIRLTGARQCIFLPGPGRYKLNGFGRTPTLVPLPQRDSLVLHWALRHDGGEGCVAGNADADGDHFLTRSTAWVGPAEPAVIDVPEEAWTANSSLTVSLIVIDNGIGTPRNAAGWFDLITLTGEPLSDVIFANGFQ